MLLLLKSSIRLFKARLGFNFEILCFSILQRVKPCFKLNSFFVRAKIFYLMLKSLCLFFNSQIYFDSVVFSLYLLLLLKENLCLVYLIINDKLDDPTDCLLFSDVITVALQIKFVNKQLPSTIHLSLQLHCFFSSSLSSNNFRL